MRLIPNAFWEKWQTRFPDNDTFNIGADDVREFAQDVKDSFASLSSLTVKQVKGATYPVSFTDSLDQIPLDYRVLGMQAMARNGVDSATGGAGVTQPPVYFQLIQDSAGDVRALLDVDTMYQPSNPTADTVRASWVKVSGTETEKVASFPVLLLEDESYKAGDVRRWTFPGGQTRLVQWKADSVGYTHPAPTGEDDDPIYRNFAPLNASGGGAMSDADVKAAYERNANTNAYTDAAKTKLTGIAAGATANATDAQLRDRATHTGTQAGTSVVLSGYGKATAAAPIVPADSAQAALGKLEYKTDQFGAPFDPYELPNTKRSQVITDAQSNANGIVLEPNGAFAGKIIIDELTVSGKVFHLECRASLQSSGTTVWKWFKTELKPSI